MTSAFLKAKELYLKSRDPAAWRAYRIQTLVENISSGLGTHQNKAELAALLAGAKRNSWRPLTSVKRQYGI